MLRRGAGLLRLLLAVGLSSLDLCDLGLHTLVDAVTESGLVAQLEQDLEVNKERRKDQSYRAGVPMD